MSTVYSKINFKLSESISLIIILKVNINNHLGVENNENKKQKHGGEERLA